MNYQQFLSGYRWAFHGAIIHELIIIVHGAAVINVIGLQQYGLLASLLSLSYLAIRIVDLGATNSLPTFLSLFLTGKKNFIYLMTWYLIVPYLITYGVIVALSGGCFPRLLTLYQDYYWLLAAEIFLGGILSFAAQFLLAVFKAREFVVVENSVLLTRITGVWIVYGFFGCPLTISLILWSHIVASLLCVAVYIVLTYRVYRTLPDQELFVPAGIAQRIINNRSANFVMRLSRNIFSSRFLTPLFAVSYGVAAAGIFYFVSKFVKVIQGAVKLSVGYVGNGLLAACKQGSLPERHAAFRVLFFKLAHIVVVMMAIGIVIGGVITFFNQTAEAYQAVRYALLMLCITGIEFFHMLYEQFYSVEEMVWGLCLLKVGELGILFVLMSYARFSSLELLGGIIVLRMISAAVIAYQFHRTYFMKQRNESFNYE